MLYTPVSHKSSIKKGINTLFAQKKNYLVTGGAGFIGANFIEYIFKKYPNASIVNLDKLTYAAQIENLSFVKDSDSYAFIHGDVCDQTLVETILRENNIDTIVHFAAESHVDRSIQDARAFIHSNILGTYSLLEAAKKVWLDEQKRSSSDCRFHHISTDEVYGALSLEDPAFTEKTLYQPNSPYSASKASSDHLVHAYHHTYGLPISLSNCSNNYGPFQHAEKLIPTVIFNCLNQQPIPIYNDGSNIRDWLYVTDHCEAIDSILSNNTCGEKYNIGGGAELTNLALTQLICEKLSLITHTPVKKYLDLIVFVPDRLGHDFRYSVNFTKIKNELQWQPKMNLEDGLHKTIHWYLQKTGKLFYGKNHLSADCGVKSTA